MNTRIGDGPSIQTGVQNVGQIKTKETGPGQGVSGQGGALGPADTGSNVMQQALAAFAPAISGNFEAKLADITAKLKQVTGEVDKDRVLNEQESKRLNMKENQAKIEDSEKKLEEAEAKKKSGNIFEKIGQAFQALGAILMAALGAIMIATGAGAAVGALLIAAAVMTMMALVNSIVQSETGAGILGNIAKAIDPDVDPNVVMGLDIGFTAVMIIGSIAATVATGGAATMGTVATIASAATQIGAGVAQIGASAFNISAAVDQSEAKQLQADTKDSEAIMQQLDDLIDQALQMLLQRSERFNALVDTVTGMMKDNTDALSATRFTG